MTDPQQPRRGERADHSLLVFLLALAVYTVGVWWGLPDGVPGRVRPWGTDELGPVGAINEVYGVFLAHQPSFNPQYPLFQYLVEVMFVAPVYIGFWLTGHLSTPAPLFPYGLDHPSWELPVLTLAARLPSLLMAAGVVVLALHTGTALRGKTVGRWAAAVVALLYPMAYYARTTNVDMGALFWTAAGLFVFARCLTAAPTRRRLWLLGLFAALAAGSKDANYAAFVPVGALATWWWVRHRLAGGATVWASMIAPLQAGVIAVVTYVMASGLVFRPSRFFIHFQYVTNGSGNRAFYFRYPPTLDGYLAFAREFGWQFVDGLGWPLLVCSVAGIGLWVARRRTLALWILPALAVCLFVIVPVRFALLRFVLPVVYVMAFPAADLLATWWGTAGRNRLLGRLAVVGVMAFTAARLVDLTAQMLDDSRPRATAWLGRVALAGDAVGHFTISDMVPRVPEGVTAVHVKPEALSTPASRPAFLVSVPLEDFEHAHEEGLPDEMFDALMAGRLGYREAGVVQGPRWFDRRPATFVNPPVRIFVRDDVWLSRPATRIAGGS